jgi:hypothetical protein
MKTELQKLQKQYGECKEANGKLKECIDVLQRKQRRAESRDQFVDSVAGEALKRKDERLLSAGKFMYEAKKRSSMFILPDDDNDELERIPRAADMTDPQIVVSSSEKEIDYDELIRTRPSPNC